ncbi:hypothetical protein MHU86_24951 [Fragilaria crotonensis]|nr:hypothetical protein MHU86_24951 [Fragilaria crotonensis]
MDEATIHSKKMVKRSHVAVQWLMRVVAEVAPRPGAMGNNTIKTHLVLHLCEDILDHGVPENVNSSYAESAHIPLAKVTSRNTQKRAVSFTKQAAHRYVENLVVSLASADMDTDRKGDAHNGVGQPVALLVDGKGGRHFNLSGRLVMNFQRAAGLTRPGDNMETAHLSTRVMDFLSQHCLPKVPQHSLPCFTLFTDRKGNKYRAHPCYDGKAWNDSAMIKWEGYPVIIQHSSTPLLIFVGFQMESALTSKQMGRKIWKPGWRYTPHFHSPDERHPTLFLVDVKSILSPVLGIEDVPPFGVEKAPRRKRCHLFLIRRKAEWPQAWDSLINKCHHDLEHDVDDDTWFEEEYEKEFVSRLPSGREVHRVKTAEEFGAEVATKKAEKVTAKKKRDDNAAEKAAAKAAKAVKATAAQQSTGNLKRKWEAPVKTKKG